ncbi:MAG: hypothetical protein WAW82_01280 [Candidatus Lutibacillus vidarii]|nr:hypothetical protein [Candidatus Lutibacillus vidarii]HON75123.1 hypothetical protein [Dermatophilaceae bacterium]
MMTTTTWTLGYDAARCRALATLTLSPVTLSAKGTGLSNGHISDVEPFGTGSLRTQGPPV